jgi:hypothetical protein
MPRLFCEICTRSRVRPSRRSYRPGRADGAGSAARTTADHTAAHGIPVGSIRWAVVQFGFGLQPADHARTRPCPPFWSANGVLNHDLSAGRGRSPSSAPTGSTNPFTAPHSTTRKGGFKMGFCPADRRGGLARPPANVWVWLVAGITSSKPRCAVTGHLVGPRVA